MQKRIEEFIKYTIENNNYKGAIIGISGGIDSAVVAKLCVNALGRDKVLGILLPERDSAKETLKDSYLVCESIGINYKMKRISPIVRALGAYSLKPPAAFIPRSIKESYVKGKWEELKDRDTYIEDLLNTGNEEFLKGLAFYRAKHRIRMCKLYLEAEQRGYAVMGTTNKSEMKTGFYVKWGDDSTDIEPIMHLYKTQVIELARQLEIPQEIINKSPSPDLIPGITDEFVLKISYYELDKILMLIETESEDINKEDSQKVNRVKEILKAAEFRNLRNLNLEGI